MDRDHFTLQTVGNSNLFLNKWLIPPWVILTQALLPLQGNYTLEERWRGEEEYVPPGYHRSPAVWGLGQFRERTGAGGKGGQRLKLQSFINLTEDWRLRKSSWGTCQLTSSLLKQPFCLLQLLSEGRGGPWRETGYTHMNNEKYVCIWQHGWLQDAD